MFHVLEGHFNTTAEINGTMAQAHKSLDTLEEYSDDEINHMLQTYKKIVFIREPMMRVLSAYRDKFVYGEVEFHQTFGKNIIKKFRKNFTGQETYENYATFNEFVKYIIDLGPNHQSNEHWELQHNLCAPCIINYDFIGNFDNLLPDAARALVVMGASEAVAFPEIGINRVHRPKTQTVLKKFFSQIPEEEFMRLENTYDIDYEMFGFYKPVYQEVIGSVKKKHILSTLFFKE